MPSDSTTSSSPLAKAAHDTLTANLQNAHALEMQVVAVLEAQLDLFSEFPELRDRVTKHIKESSGQARRIEAALEACGESASAVKDTLLSIMGVTQSSTQSFSTDAVLKAVAADVMTEHLEITTYRTLIVLAGMAGRAELQPDLEASLREEEAMAGWLEQNMERITRRFVEMRTATD